MLIEIPQRTESSLQDEARWRLIALRFGLTCARHMVAPGWCVWSFELSDLQAPFWIGATCSALLAELGHYNARVIRAARVAGDPLPSIFDGGVRFSREPWEGQREEFADLETVLSRGWADCDDAVAAMLGELEVRGEIATPTATAQKLHDYQGQTEPPLHMQPHAYHGRVRRADGTISDPAKMLGM